MIKMQQKAFATIEKSETKDVVVDKCELRTDHDIEQIEPAMTCCNCNLSAG